MKKKALLFIHGFAGGTYDYGELINDLELNGLFDIFSYTMKGHGNLVINKVTKDDWIKDAEYNIDKLIKYWYIIVIVILTLLLTYNIYNLRKVNIINPAPAKTP